MFSARIMAQAKGLAIRTEKENKAGETIITVLGSNRGGGFHFKQTFFLNLAYQFTLYYVRGIIMVFIHIQFQTKSCLRPHA